MSSHGHTRRLEEKVAIITGAGQGLGTVTAELFARHGARIVVVDVDESAAEAVANGLVAQGSQATAIAADVSSSDAVRALVAGTIELHGRIDVLVNNAAIVGGEKNVIDLGEDVWERVMAVNLRGPFLCTKYVAKQMRDQGGGSIVNISSLSGLIAHENQADYNASKHGLIGLTRCTAQDCARFGIRANAVCPGAMNTPMMQIRPREAVAATAAQSLFGRWAEPFEVAHAVLFLASDESSFITGTTLVVDGGVSAIQASTEQLVSGIESFVGGER
jgi:3-oxoacyl-[acyl-carrier protein] reductase